MINNQNNFEELTERLNSYVITSIDLLKLQTTERSSAIGAKLFSSMVLTLFFVLIFVLLSIGISIYISNFFDSNYFGFIILSGSYLVIALIIFFARKMILENPFKNKLIRNIYNK